MSENEKRIALRVEPDVWQKWDDQRHKERTSFQELGVRLFTEWFSKAGESVPQTEHLKTAPVPKSEQSLPLGPNVPGIVLNKPFTKGAISTKLYESLSASEVLWVGKLLRLLRSGKFPVFAESITKNLDGFDFGLQAAEELARLKVSHERQSVAHADAKADIDSVARGIAEASNIGRGIQKSLSDPPASQKNTRRKTK